MAQNTISGDLRVGGDIILTKDGAKLKPPPERSFLAQETLKSYPVDLRRLEVFDSGAQLPAAATSDDLGYVIGTHGTNTPRITSGDCKIASTTRKARFTIKLPPEYDPGQSVQVVVTAGMETTIADGSCTVDLAIFKADGEGGVDGSDLVSTTGQSINSLTKAEKTFLLTDGGLLPGDQLDVLLTIACVDSATATPVTPVVSRIDVKMDIKG